MKFFARILPALFVAVLFAGSALAQDAPPPPPPETEAADDARALYGAALESAEQATASGTADGHIQAGDEYLRAAEIAETSGDEELEPLARGAREAAVRSFVDAGSTYAGQQSFSEAGAQFSRAAEIAEMLGDTALQARVTSNAGTAFVQAQEFDRAVASFERAAELNPDNLDYAYLRAVAIRGGGDHEAAIAAFNEVITAAEAAEDDENRTKASDALGRMYLIAARDELQAQNWRAAISTLDQAAEHLDEEDTNLNTMYANAYYRLGVGQVQAEQWGAARTSLQRAQDFARKAGRDQIIQGAQQQLDYIQQVQG